MKKIILILLLFASLQANDIACGNDVYFGNGINTSEVEADDAKDEMKEQFRVRYPAKFDAVSSWQISYNHTHGIGIDLYESMLQKIYETPFGALSISYHVADLFGRGLKDIVKKVGKKVAKKAIRKYTSRLIRQATKSIAEAYWVKYKKQITKQEVELIYKEIFNQLIDEFIDNYIEKTEEEVMEQESRDMQTQAKAYLESIKNGNEVIVVAHSQGNLFANRFLRHFIFQPSENLKNSYHVISIATPADNVLDKKSPYKTFDNDIITLVPWSLKHNIKNPKRYYGVNALGEKIEFIVSFKAHEFLASYMATGATRKFILDNIEKNVNTVKYNSEPITPKQGAVEVTLSWEEQTCRQKKALNLDLSTSWDKGEFDVKDKNVSFEHFVIKDIMDVYPGTYKFFAHDKSNIELLDIDETYKNPINIYVSAKTPAEVKLYKLKAETLSQLDIGKILEMQIYVCT